MQQQHLGVRLHLDEGHKVDQGRQEEGHHAGRNGQQQQKVRLAGLKERCIDRCVNAGGQAQQGLEDADHGAPALHRASISAESMHVDRGQHMMQQWGLPLRLKIAHAGHQRWPLEPGLCIACHCRQQQHDCVWRSVGPDCCKVEAKVAPNLQPDPHQHREQGPKPAQCA